MLEIKDKKSTIKICNYCGEINYDNVNLCQGCGNMLKDFTHIFCEICGTKNSVENKICYKCKNLL